MDFDAIVSCKLSKKKKEQKLREKEENILLRVFSLQIATFWHLRSEFQPSVIFFYRRE